MFRTRLGEPSGGGCWRRRRGLVGGFVDAPLGLGRISPVVTQGFRRPGGAPSPWAENLDPVGILGPASRAGSNGHARQPGGSVWSNGRARQPGGSVWSIGRKGGPGAWVGRASAGRNGRGVGRACRPGASARSGWVPPGPQRGPKDPNGIQFLSPGRRSPSGATEALGGVRPPPNRPQPRRGVSAVGRSRLGLCDDRPPIDRPLQTRPARAAACSIATRP